MLTPGLGVLGSPLLAQAVKPGALAAGAGAKPLAPARVVRATLVLFAIASAAGAVMLARFYPAIAVGDRASVDLALNIGFGAGVVAISLVVLTAFRRPWAPLTAPVGAAGGGAFATGLAIGFEARHPGVALQALALTAVLFLLFLVLHQAGVITVTRRFRTAVFTATAAIGIVYLASFLLGFAGIRLPVIHGAGVGGVLWGGFVVTIATLNLVVDFERVAALEGRPAPPWAAWFVALGLLVTLVWLYVSVLRLLARARRFG